MAFIPARAGSTRVPGKNVRELAGHPLIAYSIRAAAESGLFDAVVVSTDSDEIAAVARSYGAEVPELRPGSLAGTRSPDIEWVRHMHEVLVRAGRTFDLFSILRPTSPFRRGATIRRAWDSLLSFGEDADSIRAVELCRQHPAKMWVTEGDYMNPLLPQPAHGVPLHSRQYQALPEVYVQNSSLEIAWTRVIDEQDSIAGRRILPFFTEGHEGLTIDHPDDWDRAERLAGQDASALPAIHPDPQISR